MKVQLLTSGYDPQTRCFVMVNNREALALIKSLVAQMQANNPNCGERLESYCKGDATEFTIMVMGTEIPE